MSSNSYPIADRICAVVMLALAGCELMHLLFDQTWAGDAARVMALTLLVAVAPRFGVREWAVTAIAVGLAIGLYLRPDGAALLRDGLGQGAFFAAFILLMMLLREAAITSASVLAVGEWITRQPPGRRFYATWFGGHIAGILLNFGAVSLLAPLIQRGVRSGATDSQIADVLERRQLSSLIRGFSMVICWAPTTLTQVIILASVPGLKPSTAIGMGLVLSAIMLVVARVEDRLRWGRPKRRGEAAPDLPRRAALDLLFVYLLLVGGALAVQALTDGSLPLALMTVSPVILIGWVLYQGWAGTLQDRSAASRLGQIAFKSVPDGAKNAYLLGTAGFIGIAAANLAPIEAMSDWLATSGLPAWSIVAAIPFIITLGGQVALSPMVMVVFLAAVVQALPVQPAPPAYLALALGAGWALSMTASPNATGALLLSGATGVPPTRLTWVWNGVYSLMVLAMMTVLAWLFV